jgi:hypothetical protein
VVTLVDVDTLEDVRGRGPVAVELMVNQRVKRIARVRSKSS